MRRFLASGLLSLGLAVAALAEEGAAPAEVDPGAILALAERPWQGRDAVLDDLAVALPGFAVDGRRFDQGLSPDDPWLWSITGRFGAARADLPAPGGIVACARYGLATRDRLAGADLAEPGIFRLLGATMAAPDDAAVWPDAAVARLSCMITWDDTRRVAILPEAELRPFLEARFEAVTRIGDRELQGENWESYAPVFGPEGYRFVARAGPETSAARVESMVVELRVTHQRILIRAFLMGGGA